MLGFMFADGRGTEKDLPTAYIWLAAAEIQGDHRGSSKLHSLEQQLTSEQLAQAKLRAQSLARSPNRATPSELAFLR